jgi:hypothetical protein
VCVCSGPGGPRGEEGGALLRTVEAWRTGREQGFRLRQLLAAPTARRLVPYRYPCEMLFREGGTDVGRMNEGLLLWAAVGCAGWRLVCGNRHERIERIRQRWRNRG